MAKKKQSVPPSFLANIKKKNGDNGNGNGDKNGNGNGDKNGNGKPMKTKSKKK